MDQYAHCHRSNDSAKQSLTPPPVSRAATFGRLARAIGLLVAEIPRRPGHREEDPRDERGTKASAPPSLSRRGEQHDAGQQAAHEQQGNDDVRLHETSLVWDCFPVTRLHGTLRDDGAEQARRVPSVGMSRRRKALTALSGLAVVSGLLLGSLNAYVFLRAGGAAHDVDGVREAQVAIVPGALVRADGHLSAMLDDRVAGAIALYRAGKVDTILVSGDHGRLGYDETDTMRDALLHQGIPARAIFTDYAGFDTWSTMERARKIFGIESAIVVTQGFHMPRALYLAKSAGLEAQGLVADRSGYGRKGEESQVRELLARVKAVGEGVTHPSVMGGPGLPITGDGRSSWGPPDPLAPRVGAISQP
jgi:SanA protein